MAKKQTNRVPDEQPEDDAPIGYENVEPEVVEFETPDGWEPVAGEAVETVEATITKPGGEAVSLDTPKDEPTYRVTFALPYGVLVALLEPGHADADMKALALYDGLVEGIISTQFPDYVLSPLGKLVLAGFDQTAVRHKMAATWREQHNRGVK